MPRSRLLQEAGRVAGEMGFSTVESLTPSELDMVSLAAEGLTNNPEIGRRLYISRYTVATHLSHVFGKLGITSRVELAALASKQG